MLFRRVEIWDAEKQEAIVFLSNLLAFGATTIAAIYKDRWQVELFFKALKNRYSKYFINFSPAISDKAGKLIREEIRSWDLHLRSDKAIEDLSRMFNPKIRGWLQYYGRYYRSAMYPYMRQLDRSLAHWAYRKYKKLRGHLRRATHWIARISRRDSKLFAHWQMGERRGSMAGAV